MKTDDLIDLLARGPVAVDARGSDRLWGRATVLGGIAATVLVVLLLGVRADLTDAVRDPMFWVKSGFVAALAAIALPLSRRLAGAGARVGAGGWVGRWGEGGGWGGGFTAANPHQVFFNSPINFLIASRRARISRKLIC